MGKVKVEKTTNKPKVKLEKVAKKPSLLERLIETSRKSKEEELAREKEQLARDAEWINNISKPDYLSCRDITIYARDLYDYFEKELLCAAQRCKTTCTIDNIIFMGKPYNDNLNQNVPSYANFVKWYQTMRNRDATHIGDGARQEARSRIDNYVELSLQRLVTGWRKLHLGISIEVIENAYHTKLKFFW